MVLRYQLLSNRNYVQTIVCHRNATELNLLFQGESALLQPPNYTFSLAICHLSNWIKAKSSTGEKAWQFSRCLPEKEHQKLPWEEGETISSCHCLFPFYIWCVGLSSHYLFSSLKVCCLHSCDWGLVKQASWMFGKQMRHKFFLFFFFKTKTSLCLRGL